MKPQDYKTHRRLVPAFHFLLFGLILIAFVTSLVNLFRALGNSENLLTAFLLLAFSICFILLFIFTRMFALKAQNRAIRAEENLRHYILTGKGLDSRLAIEQIIALRFAPDEELVPLATEAAAKNLAPDAIKQAIKNWKADHHRV